MKKTVFEWHANDPIKALIATHQASAKARVCARPLPISISGQMCGARTRAGTPCKRKDIWFNGRCKLHGGLSTGPKTREGRRQSAENGRKGGRPPKSRTSGKLET